MALYRVGLIHKSLRISDLCGTETRMVTPKGSMSTEGERDTPSFCPTLQVLDMSTLGDAAKYQSCNQVPATHVATADGR
jgi:hypothetical protein